MRTTNNSYRMSPSDKTFGAFSNQPPWLIDPQQLEWLDAIDSIRVTSRQEVPELLRKRRLPPGLRVTTTAYYLGKAVGAWRLFDQKQSRSYSRSGLARRLRTAFEALGPTYIKLGQIISSGEGLFPPELVNEFKMLRDQVSPESFNLVRSTIENELGQELEELFSEFDQTALAAASIAQVHIARLRTGEEVVVKVQRSTIDRAIREDLAAMSWFAPALVGRIPVTSLANPPSLVEVFAETIVEELDFRLEAANMLDIARILVQTNQTALVVPRPHPKYVTRKVLVMERLSGYAWDDVTGMRNVGIDTSEVIRAGMIAFMEGAMIFGIFHGDLHGGNLLVQPDGVVALLDYGMTGRLSEAKRLAFLRLLMGGTINDVRMQVTALRDLGALPVDTEIEEVISDLGLDGPPIDPTTLTPEELSAQVREITKALLGYGAKMPKELMLFIKNMLFLDSSMPKYAPDVDIFAEITSLATYFATKHGAKIASDVGIDPRNIPVDLEGVRGSLGLDSSVQQITYQELHERREVIRKRMQNRAKAKKRVFAGFRKR
ncbi:MAG: AarF/ABC1/UbiB kinase family protein [Acidimicrobiaceae bacterium]|nr:AarF/ABC1/UbiB kinase family protein [Acidimicrobiaceae bacterium]